MYKNWFMLSMFKIAILCAFFACNSQVETEKVNKKSDEYDNLLEAKDKYEYKYEDESVLQKLTFTYDDDNKIRFEYLSQNKIEICEQIIKGIAIDKNTDMDPDLDEDEEGVAYPAIKYTYEEEGCRLSFKVEMLKKDKVQVYSVGCEEKNNTTCILSSVGILR